MALFGVFGKKAPETFASQISQELELPEVPPLEDLDLPPPPQYPRQEARPVMAERELEQPTPVKERPFIIPQENMEIPVEKLIAPKPQQAAPSPVGMTMTVETAKPIATVEATRQVRPVEAAREAEPVLTREKILDAIGIQPKENVFVKVDEYREILEGTNRIRDNLKEATEVILRLNELKGEEDKEFEKWRLELEDVQRKLMYVDKIIFESG